MNDLGLQALKLGFAMLKLRLALTKFRVASFQIEFVLARVMKQSVPFKRAFDSHSKNIKLAGFNQVVESAEANGV